MTSLGHIKLILVSHPRPHSQSYVKDVTTSQVDCIKWQVKVKKKGIIEG